MSTILNPLREAKALVEKWNGVLEHSDAPAITDSYKKQVTAVLLENQVNAIKEAQTSAGMTSLGQIAGGATAGDITYQDTVLVSLVRRTMPAMVAFDIASVQPLSGPTGLVFGLKSRYDNPKGEEAYWPGKRNQSGEAAEAMAVPATNAITGEADPFAGQSIHGGFSLATGEGLGTQGGGEFGQMALSIGKAMVEAKTRALKAEYTTELEQDLKAVHGLSASDELASILTNEIVAEMNREVFNSIYTSAILGGRGSSGVAGAYNQFGGKGIVNLDDVQGRWLEERFKGLMFNIEQDANDIGLSTLRGRGNIVICSADVASALALAGVLTYAPEMNKGSGLDTSNMTENPFVGTLQNKFKVFVDPYATTNFYSVGYKGNSPYDSGMIYCPYVPLQKYNSVDPVSFQPKIGFKTRYAMAVNPFANLSTNASSEHVDVRIKPRENKYYRIAKVLGLAGE